MRQGFPYLLLGLCLTTAGSATGGQASALSRSDNQVFCQLDAGGQSLFAQHARRSPTGLRFRIPCRIPENLTAQGGDDDPASHWRWIYQVEVGWLLGGGDDEESLYREFRDWSNGPVLSALTVSGADPEERNFIELRASSPWRDDGYVKASYDKPGSLSIDASYDRVPHRYADGIRTLFEGLGTDRLGLPADLEPGANGVDAIAAAVDRSPQVNSEIERTRYLLDLSYRPLRDWRLTASYTHDQRDGTRPISAANSYSFIDAGVGSTVEMLQPIEYTTNEIELGVEWSAGPWALRAAWYGSYFDNDAGSLTWDNPFTNGGFAPFPEGSPVIAQGRFDLAPDNDFEKIMLDLRRELPWRGSLSLALHQGRMRQDDALIPHSVNQGTGGTPLQPINLSDWNTVESLSRLTADARIDTFLGLIDMNIRPLDKLTLRGRIRIQDDDNDTRYENFNPLTGEYGYIVEDGAHAAVFPFESGLFVPGMPGSEWHTRSIPFANDETRQELGADWRVARRTTVSIDLTRESIERQFRQVEQTDENRLRLALNHRGFEKATLRASFERGDRAGGDYRPFPYADFWTDSLEGFVPAFDDGRTAYALNSLRMFDVADRDQNLFQGRLHYLLGPRSDIAFMVQHESNDFDAEHGLRDQREWSMHLEYSFVPAHDQRFHAWLSRQDGRSTLHTIRDVGPVGANGDPGGPVFPLVNAWQADFDDTSLALGAGLERPLGPVLWRLDLSYLDSDSAIEYDYASASALATPLQAEQAGNAFPDISFSRGIVETSVLWPFHQRWSLRLLYRYERGRISDWHYDGSSYIAGRSLYLGVDPDDYAAHTIGLLLQFAGGSSH